MLLIPYAREIFAFVSLIATLLIYVPYIVAILKKQVKPHIFSWIVWGIGNLSVCAAQWSTGGGLGAALTGLGGFFCLLIAILSTHYGEKNITRADWIMFLAALSALPLWAVTKNPLSAVVLLTVIDVLAAVPTMRKSYHKPFEESVWLFFFSAVRFGVSIPALDALNLTTVLFPSVLGITNLMVTILLIWRRRVMPRTLPP